MGDDAGLRDAPDRFAQMLSNSATAAICAGPHNLIRSWNSAAESLFGFAAEQAIGRSLSIVISERHRAAHEAGLARAVKAVADIHCKTGDAAIVGAVVAMAKA